ncbi:MAG: restriction endonuclease subunit S [Sediminibacterium sp.]|nr:restriction endonuclease subunit S [Sediminibacterium sp.]
MELVAKKYKQTDIGIIPIDWDVKRLLDVSDFSNGKAHEQSIDEAGDFVVVNSKFISTEGEIFKNSNQAISPLAKGDITLVMSDIPNGKALAKCYLIEIDNKYTLNQRICSIKTRVCDNVFLFYVLNRNKYFLSFDSGSGQTNLRRNEVLDCPLAIPPTIAEQTSIATAISNIDELISQTEKLIEKKKAIKQGVMQELLKAKEGWVTKKLGDVCEIYTGKKNNQDKIEDGEYPFFVRSQTIERSNSYSYDGEAILVPGEGNIGNIFHYINGKFDFHQRVYKISDFSEMVYPKYVYLYIKENFGKYALSNSVKATVDSLRLPTFQEFILPFPNDINEQKEIAEVIFSLDKEIEMIELKLQKLKLQKQGMMQALLTGKIRLL